MANNNPALTAEQIAVNNKNKIEKAVLNKIAALSKAGGIRIPQGFHPGNEIALALLELSDRKEANGSPTLAVVESASVAQSLFRMCILGLSLARKQCSFIRYGNKLQFQPQYHGNMALAKRLGGAGQPRAQVIYKGDEFEYIIDTKTGNKVVTKHVQSLANIDNANIIGAWALVPYADDPERQPYVEVMTMDEIRKSWQQGATKGNSPAHLNFTQEMCKKTVINRACKLFITASDESGMYETYTDNDKDLTQDAPEQQEQPEVIEVNLDALDETKVIEAVKDAPESESHESPESHEPEPAPAERPQAGTQDNGKGLFNGLD
jgi:recombination protein RecT